MPELKLLNEKNMRPGRIDADLTPDKQVLQDVGRKKADAPKRGELAAWMQERFQISVRRSSALATAVNGVRQEPCTRPKRAAAANLGHCHESPAVWLAACAGDTAARECDLPSELGNPKLEDGCLWVALTIPCRRSANRFAIRTLLGRHREGTDVETKLPALSTYHEHPCVRGTYWYRSARPELMQEAARRLDQRWEAEP